MKQQRYQTVSAYPSLTSQIYRLEGSKTPKAESFDLNMNWKTRINFRLAKNESQPLLVNQNKI